MPERDSYAPGTPSWVDIGTDVASAKAFYSGLFGWDSMEAGPPEETGGYGFFLKDGKLAAGYGPQMNPGPPVWTSYVAVADADEAAAKVTAASGTVLMAPMDVMTAGRMAVFQDPGGAFFSVWQARDHPGAQVRDEPNTLCWIELATRDVEAAKSFYNKVFGWSALTHGEGASAYTEFARDGEPVAGAMTMQPGMEEVPPHWLVYFAVEDTDGCMAKAQALGGSVVFGPMDIETGRFAVLNDTSGATFGVIQLTR